MQDDVREELVRLRDRLHKVETGMVAVEIEAKNQRRWREQITPIVEDLREADRIAEKVAEKMSENAQTALTNVSLGLSSRQTKAAVWAAWIGAGALVITAVSLTLQAFGVIG